MTTENASPDCLVVLGARITPDGRPGRIARLRVEHALKLWLARGATGCLILSGGCSREGLAVSEARAMADHALSQVQTQGGRELRDRLAACLVLEEESRTTREAARHTLPLILARNLGRRGPGFGRPAHAPGPLPVPPPLPAAPREPPPPPRPRGDPALLAEPPLPLAHPHGPPGNRRLAQDPGPHGRGV